MLVLLILNLFKFYNLYITETTLTKFDVHQCIVVMYLILSFRTFCFVVSFESGRKVANVRTLKSNNLLLEENILSLKSLSLIGKTKLA